MLPSNHRRTAGGKGDDTRDNVNFGKYFGAGVWKKSACCKAGVSKLSCKDGTFFCDKCGKCCDSQFSPDITESKAYDRGRDAIEEMEKSRTA